MDMQKAASLFTMLLVGLFLGANLGVLLMCMMRMASPEPKPKNEASLTIKEAHGNGKPT